MPERLLAAPKRYTTATAMMEDVFTTYGDRLAFTYAGQRHTYADINRLSRQFAVYLQQHLHLSPGDVIAFQLPNITQYPVAVFGAIRAGLVVVNINPLYTPNELEHQLIDSGAKVLVVLANVAAAAAQVVQKTQVKTVIVTEFADLMPWPKRPLINFIVRRIKKLVPQVQFAEQVCFNQALALGNTGELIPVAKQPDDILCLQYTGGTTGKAKGAMLSHFNVCSNSWQVLERNTHLIAEHSEVFATVLPLYHIYAFCLHLFGGFSLGVHNLLIPNPRDLPALVKALAHTPPTVFIGLNTIFKALSLNAQFQRLDFSRLHATTSGGMALTQDAATAWKKITGCEICPGYGLTEASPVVSSNIPSTNQTTSVGQPLIETQIKLVDAQGNDVPAGGEGELCVKGPQVMLGYWQQPEETKKVMLPGGWLKTGDIAQIQADGHIKIVDRKKDMIIVSGFNVYPNELEDVLCSHPCVLESAVIGVPDEKSGEAVKAFLVVKESCTEEDIRRHCKRYLTAYKIPKYIEFKDSLPKSNVGKILRRELRVEAQ
ncbi:MAG TPA: AMP-binding protein [Cellvibrionaceae bacterium]